MRKLHTNLSLLLLIAVALFSSCSKSSSGGGGGGTNDVTSVSITASRDSVYSDNFDVITFRVVDNKGNDVTSSSQIQRNGTPISGWSFKTSQDGSLSFNAKYNNLTSNTITIKSVKPRFTRKVLVEDFTGTWCGWCPLMSNALIQKEGTTPSLIVTAVHYGPNPPGGSTHDPYHSSLTTSLTSRYGINAYPTALVNRTSNASSTSVTGQIDFELAQGRPHAGLSIQSSLAGSTLNATVKVTFDENFSGQTVKLVAYVVEDNLKANQTNYVANNGSYVGHPYYSSGNPIVNFDHDHVLRASATNVLGDLIPAASTIKNAEYSKDLTFNLGAYNAANCKIIAFIITDDGSTRVINAQQVTAGQNKAYD
jgi:thiol-disulfide isomerase/thioredoxin